MKRNRSSLYGRLWVVVKRFAIEVHTWCDNFEHISKIVMFEKEKLEEP